MHDAMIGSNRETVNPRTLNREPRTTLLPLARAMPGALMELLRGSPLSDGKVTFEVVMHAFGLEQDPALKALGELVHYIDAGGIPVDAAAGVETVVRGLLAQHADDDQLLEASLPLFDSLYAAMRTTHD